MQAPVPESATPSDLPIDTRRKVSELFTRDELRMLNERSNLRGFLAVGFTWSVIVATLAALGWVADMPPWMSVPCFALGMIVLGGRHLGLAILHHEAAHKSLFRTPWLNDLIGDFLCARPTWNNLRKYREHHFIHHRRTGQADDTDLSLVTPFPTSRASLARKLARDLSGLTGLKSLYGRALMDLGIIKWTVASDVTRLPQEGRSVWSYPGTFIRNASGMLLTNVLFYAVCWASGHPFLYAVWVLSYLTPFPLFLRIRSMAEHACAARSTDMFLNTRTTRAGLLARATVAPIRVNFHIEHHVLPSVPYFRLPLVHRMLRQRGAAKEPPGYLDVLRLVSSRSSQLSR